MPVPPVTYRHSTHGTLGHKQRATLSPFATLSPLVSLDAPRTSPPSLTMLTRITLFSGLLLPLAQALVITNPTVMTTWEYVRTRFPPFLPSPLQ